MALTIGRHSSRLYNSLRSRSHSTCYLFCAPFRIFLLQRRRESSLLTPRPLSSTKETEPNMNTIPCTIKILEQETWIPAANTAIAINPANAPAVDFLKVVAPYAAISPEQLALLTSKYWGR